MDLLKLPRDVVYIETSTSLGSLQKFEGAAGEFKGALGYRHQGPQKPEGSRCSEMQSQPYVRPFFLGVQDRLAGAQLFFFMESELNYFFH